MAAFLLSLARRNFTRRNFRSPAACRLFSASSSSDPLADVSLGAGKLSSGGGSSPFSPDFTDLGPSFVGLAGKLKTLAASSLELSDGSTVLSHGCSSPDFTDLGPSFVGLAGKLKTLAACPSEKVSSPFSHGIPKYARVDPSVVLVKRNTNNGSYGDKKTTTFGTGFFIDNHGTILTCLDLVRNPYVPSSCYSVSKNVIKVTLPSGDLVDGTLLGGDANLDVALVKVDIEDTAPVQLSSSPIRAGEWFVAIGSPEGIDFSITQGIISCVGRSKTELGLPDMSGKDTIFIQTDCVLSDGSQGSPLVNLEGEVIGVIVLSHTLCTGIGFAAPISTIVVSFTTRNIYIISKR